MEDLFLRDVMEGDLSSLFAHQADPDACRMAAFKPRDLGAFMSHWSKILTDVTVTKRTVLVGREVAGTVMSFERSGEHHIGYWFGREYWGKGVATTALREFLRVDRRRPLHAHVATQNRASIRVLEKCGFVVSRHDRPPADERNEEVDEVIMVLLEHGETKLG